MKTRWLKAWSGAMVLGSSMTVGCHQICLQPVGSSGVYSQPCTSCSTCTSGISVISPSPVGMPGPFTPPMVTPPPVERLPLPKTSVPPPAMKTMPDSRPVVGPYNRKFPMAAPPQGPSDMPTDPKTTLLPKPIAYESSTTIAPPIGVEPPIMVDETIVHEEIVSVKPSEHSGYRPYIPNDSGTLKLQTPPSARVVEENDAQWITSHHQHEPVNVPPPIPVVIPVAPASYGPVASASGLPDPVILPNGGRWKDSGQTHQPWANHGSPSKVTPTVAVTSSASEDPAAFVHKATYARQQTGANSIQPGSWGHNSDYSWLAGQIEYSHVDRCWRIRYAGVDQADTYGGSAILICNQDDRKLQNLKEGQYIRVSGKFEDGQTRNRIPRYRVADIQSAGY